MLRIYAHALRNVQDKLELRVYNPPTRINSEHDPPARG
jgi:hypothetical protein